MRFVVLVVMLVAFLVPSSALAAPTGFGFGVGAFDGEFGVQARKDLYLGGDISQITFQGSVVFANRTVFVLDADYHFLLESGKGRFYPLVGVNFAFNSDDAEFGVNAGGGLNFMLTDTLAAWAELKYVFFGWDGFVITGGIKF